MDEWFYSLNEIRLTYGHYPRHKWLELNVDEAYFEQLTEFVDKKKMWDFCVSRYVNKIEKEEKQLDLDHQLKLNVSNLDENHQKVFYRLYDNRHLPGGFWGLEQKERVVLLNDCVKFASQFGINVIQWFVMLSAVDPLKIGVWNRKCKKITIDSTIDKHLATELLSKKQKVRDICQLLESNIVNANAAQFSVPVHGRTVKYSLLSNLEQQCLTHYFGAKHNYYYSNKGQFNMRKKNKMKQQRPVADNRNDNELGENEKYIIRKCFIDNYWIDGHLSVDDQIERFYLINSLANPLFQIPSKKTSILKFCETQRHYIESILNDFFSCIE